VGCPIRTSADLSLLPAPRGVSPVAASFFASLCQGIHRVPLLTCRYVFQLDHRCALASSSIILLSCCYFSTYAYLRWAHVVRLCRLSTVVCRIHSCVASRYSSLCFALQQFPNSLYHVVSAGVASLHHHDPIMTSKPRLTSAVVHDNQNDASPSF
jgi:hypothetical protein